MSGMNTSAISDSDAPDMNETGMFVDEPVMNETGMFVDED